MANRGFKIAVISGAFLVSIGLFQNCGQDVEFQDWDELAKAGIKGDLRTESFNPTKPENKPKINLDTIVDNSFSMTAVQKELQNGFANVAYKLKGLSGAVNLYTTTQDKSGEKMSFLEKKLARFVNNQGKTEVIDFDQVATKIPADKPYDTLVKYLISSPFLSEGQSLQYRFDMEDSQFDAFANSYSESIGSLGISGSDKEQGLCSLLRALEKNEDRSIFQTYIIAGNEDDDSSALDCLNEKVQTITKSPDSSSINVTCSPGEPGCENTFQVNFNSETKKTFRYKYRYTSEQFFYSIPSTTTIRNYAYVDKHTEKLKYKYMKKNEFLEYNLIKVRDLTEYVDSEITKSSLGSSYGTCSSNRRACTPSELSSLAGTNIDEGSCYYTCSQQEETAPVKNLTTSFGSCSSQAKTTRSCSDSELTNAKGSIPSSAVVSCEVSCSDSLNVKYNFAENRENPLTCDGFDTSCTSGEINDALIKIGIVNSPELLKSCQSTCSNNKTSYSKWMPSAHKSHQCAGVAADQSGNNKVDGEYPSCTEDQLQILATATGKDVSEITQCSYSCSQSISSHKYTGTQFATCSPGSLGVCNESELGFVESNTGLGGRVTSCDNYCYTDTSKVSQTCELKSTATNLCEDFADNPLYSKCDSQFSNYSANRASCKITQSFKQGSKITYNEVPGQWSEKSLIENESEEELIQSIAKKIRKTHGDRFYLAAFVYPTDDQNCEPDNPGLSKGKRFEMLAKELGGVNAQVFPICMPDYSIAFENVFDIVVREVNRSYTFNINVETEWVWKVKFVNPDGSITVVDPEDYRIDKTVITFKSEEMLKGIQDIQIEIVTPEVFN